MAWTSRTDFAVANWWARILNEARYMLGRRSGKHRSFGLSTFEWVRIAQVSREC